MLCADGIGDLQLIPVRYSDVPGVEQGGAPKFMCRARSVVTLSCRVRPCAREDTLHGAAAGDVKNRGASVADGLAGGSGRVPDRASRATVAVARVRIAGELIPTVTGLIDVVVDVRRCQCGEPTIVDQAQVPGCKLCSCVKHDPKNGVLAFVGNSVIKLKGLQQSIGPPMFDFVPTFQREGITTLPLSGHVTTAALLEVNLVHIVPYILRREEPRRCSRRIARMTSRAV